jgi:(E)-4-hydroxy-3-methylbut-2-enyl-diphosphate synthase
MVLSALQSTELALESGLRTDQIIISCKVSRPSHLIQVYRALARQTDQPLHLGLTEAGMGIKGLVWSASAMGVLLERASATRSACRSRRGPAATAAKRCTRRASCCRRSGLRTFAPSVTACPGCGRTTSSTFQELAERVQQYIRDQMPRWKLEHEGVETLTLAVMGCVVNGPGESKAANIGISLPGTGEAPTLPRLHRRRARGDAARHLRRAGRRVSAARRRLRRPDLSKARERASLALRLSGQAGRPRERVPPAAGGHAGR